ncbi:MAG TPA: hypothetical protein VI790_02625 [Candidatus Nanoarchaeia archaeon]|nr:hypothetical protein [Candidatus Nanoarchaeia archaeon]
MESFISLLKAKAVIFKNWLESNDYFRVYASNSADCLASVVILVNLFKSLGKSFHLSFLSNLSADLVSPDGCPVIFIGFNDAVNSGRKSLLINNQEVKGVVESPDLANINAFGFNASISGVVYLFSKEFVTSTLCAKIAVIGAKAGLIDLNSSINQLIINDIPSGLDSVYANRGFDEWINMVNQCISNGTQCLAVGSFLNAR